MGTRIRMGALLLGALIMMSSWLSLVLQEPSVWQSKHAESFSYSLPILGFGAAAVLIFLSIEPQRLRRFIKFVPLAVVLNIAIGTVVGSIGIPLYLDNIFTIAIGVAFGPVAGLLTGLCTNLVWGITEPSMMPFAMSAATSGFLAGAMAKVGGFGSAIGSVFSGLGIGLLTAILSAPVAVLLFEAKDFGGTNALVSVLMHNEHDLVGSVMLQSLISDPIDKTLSAFLAFWVLRFGSSFLRRGERQLSVEKQ